MPRRNGVARLTHTPVVRPVALRVRRVALKLRAVSAPQEDPLRWQLASARGPPRARLLRGRLSPRCRKWPGAGRGWGAGQKAARPVTGFGRSLKYGGG